MAKASFVVKRNNSLFMLLVLVVFCSFVLATRLILLFNSPTENSPFISEVIGEEEDDTSTKKTHQMFLITTENEQKEENVNKSNHRHNREEGEMPHAPTTGEKEASTYLNFSRTHHGEYNEFLNGKKYFIYNPTGGFNNQRVCFQNAIEIARLTNRTLYVPMAAKHTSSWTAYEKLSSEYLFPMDRIIDFEYLLQYDEGVSLVPLNVTLSSFIGKLSKTTEVTTIVQVDTTPEWKKDQVITKLAPIKSPVLYLRGNSMYHNWFAVKPMMALRRKVRYSPSIRKLALSVVNEKFGGKNNFYALHIRMGDSIKRWEAKGLDSKYFLGRAKAMKWKLKDLPVYVSTDANSLKKHAYFYRAINAEMKTVYFKHLPQNELNAFKDLFPKKSSFRMDMVGVVEQLVCSFSKAFIGSDFSSFSNYIRFTRVYSSEVLPESVTLSLQVENGMKEHDEEEEMMMATTDENNDINDIIQEEHSSSLLPPPNQEEERDGDD